MQGGDSSGDASESLRQRGLRAQNPWYLRPFFGSTPVIEPRALRVLFVVAIGVAFENYDLAIVNAALPRFGPDLDIAAESSGFYLGAIRAGGILAFLLVMLGDRLGRRRVFLAVFIGMSAATAATAFTQTALQFTLLQALSRGFMLTAATTALVFVVEEFPPSQRGAGLGMLALLGALGYGICVALYGIVDWLPFGWRTLYLIGLAPIAVLPFLRGALRETRSYSALEDARTADGQEEHWLDPLRQLARHPRNAILVGGAGLLSSAGGLAVFQYVSTHVEGVHGWTTAQFSLLTITAGGLGVMGNTVGGRLADRFGRRAVGCLACLGAPVFAALFYLGPAATLVLAWAGFVFFQSAADLVVRALSAELFPTSHRSTSAGWLILLQTTGWITGLFVVAGLAENSGALATSITMVASVIGLAGLCLLAVPETRGQRLEQRGD